MPWEKAYDESEVLERAMHAFWARGYEATSMGDLVKATGINRGSIYAAFSGKRDLFIRALHHYDTIHRAEFLAAIGADHEPKDAIIAVFQAAATPSKRQPGGCLLVNTVLEISPHDAEIRELVEASLAKVEDFFHDRIEAAKRRGEIAAARPARPLAQALLGLFLGLRVVTRSDPPPRRVDAIIDQARAMLQ